MFEYYLPYAAAFGLVSEWGKVYSRMTNVRVPTWLQGLGSSLDDGSFTALLAVLSATDSSASTADGGMTGGDA
jgi:hypothetical protein